MKHSCGQHPFHHGVAGPYPHKIVKIAGLAVAGLFLAAFFGLAFGWLVMLLWNWLLPDLFGVKVITYWQAFGIVILAKLLFGGFHHGPPHGRHHRMGHHGHCDGGDDWAPAGNHENWRHYRHYWKERGKSDFEKYLAERVTETVKD